MKNSYKGKFIVLEGGEGSGKTTQLPLLTQALLEQKGDGPPRRIIPTKEPTENGVFGKLARSLYSAENALNADRIRAIVDEFFQSADYRWITEQMWNALGSIHRRPHISAFDRLAREILNGRTEPLARFLVLTFIFDRFQHRVEQEIAWLEAGDCVVSDRDFLSGLAHADSEGFPWREVLKIHEEILGPFFIVPDLVIFLDVPVEVGLARTAYKQNDRQERFDTTDQQIRIKNAYHEILQDPEIQNVIPSVIVDGTPRDPLEIHHSLWQEIQPFLAKWLNPKM